MSKKSSIIIILIIIAIIVIVTVVREPLCMLSEKDSSPFLNGGFFQIFSRFAVKHETQMLVLYFGGSDGG